MNTLPKKVELTGAQERAMTEARVAFMRACPFFAYYFYDQMVEWPTKDIPSAGTDGRRIFYNPEFMERLPTLERAFVLAHEVYHVIWRHPLRMKNYARTGFLRKLPYVGTLFNISADYVINHALISLDIGRCNPDWLYDPTITSDQLVEDVYEKLYQKMPPPPRGGKEGGGEPSTPEPSTRGRHNRGSGSDPGARANGGRFDEVIEPYTDPSGREDVPTESEFKESIARAAAAAKAAGNLPAKFQSMIDEIMEPQVNWKEYLRMNLTGRLGARRETWEKPNRRRLVLNPIIYLPGKRGHGAELVVCVVDCSGSVSEHELAAFFAEMTSILGDCKPKEVMVIWCDAAVQRVDRARLLDELAEIRIMGAPGRGGTSFRPPFNYIKTEDIRPDTLVYLTDMMPNDGWPDEPKTYPVVWCATTPTTAPWGETVRIDV